MDPSTAAAATGSVHFLNIEYIFYLIYTALFGVHSTGVGGGGINLTWIATLLTNLWLLITVLAYLVTLGFLALIIYASMRMYQTLDEETLKYVTVSDAHHAEEITEHHRWTHVRALIEGTSPNDWRQAIIEADIILDDMLTRLGYVGDSIGEKLKKVNPAQFKTLQEAWEAHKIRNEIAHQGSEFLLTDHVAYRTIMQYENVFKEHGEI